MTPQGEPPLPEPARRTRALFAFTVVSLGAAALATQLVFFRELLEVCNGNELVLGVLLACWLALFGAGAALGGWIARRWNPPAAVARLLLPLSLLPLGELFLARALRESFFMRGVMPGPLETLLAALGLLAPYCLLAGLALPLASAARESADREDRRVGRVYLLDALGSLAGGLLFTLAALAGLDSFRLLELLSLAQLGMACAWGFTLCRPGTAWPAAALGAAVLAGAIGYDLDGISTRLSFSGRKVVWRGVSPHGRVVVTDSGGQYDFYAYGGPEFSTADLESVEETAGFASAFAPRSGPALLIGRGVSGTARRLAEGGAERVDYVEPDAALLAAARRLAPANVSEPPLRILEADGRRFLRETKERYAAVVVDLPAPATAQFNRFFTQEFCAAVKGVLAEGGVFCASLGEYHDYVSPEQARELAAFRATLETCFRRVHLWPGLRIFFVASDAEWGAPRERLGAEIAARLEARGFRAKYLTREYLESALSLSRLQDLARAAKVDGEVNRDAHPVLYLHRVRYWLSQFQTPLAPLTAAAVLLAVVLALTRKAAPLAVFVSGFATSGLELGLLLAFQALYGGLQLQLGLFFAAFMCGLAAGAWWAQRRPAGRKGPALAAWGAALAVLAATLNAALPALSWLEATACPAVLGQALFLGLTWLLGALAGAEFAAAGRAMSQEPGRTAGALYASDCAGAALGALLAGALLLPLFGLTWFCLLIAGVKALSVVVVWLRLREA